MIGNIEYFINTYLNERIKISWEHTDDDHHANCYGHHVRVEGRVVHWSLEENSLLFRLQDAHVLPPSEYESECSEPTNWVPFQSYDNITVVHDVEWELSHGAHYDWYYREYNARIWFVAGSRQRTTRALVFLLDPRNKATIR